MRQITCPVCSTPPKNSPEPLTIIGCQSCGVQWTFIPEPIDDKALYRDEVYAIVDNRTSIFEKIIFSEAKRILHKARKLNPNTQHLLDFGSGKGQFLAIAKKLNWNGIGIETEQARADFAREKYRVDVISSYYESGKIGENLADLISLNHVLEHLPNPVHLLGELLSANLKPQGIVYIEVPRADSWQAKIAGKHWMHWDIPKHLTHWTKPELSEQMGKLGFSAVGTRSYSVHLGVLGMLQALLARLGYRENLILRLKRRKTLGLLLLIGFTLPIAWTLEVFSLGFGKSGILGLYFQQTR